MWRAVVVIVIGLTLGGCGVDRLILAPQFNGVLEANGKAVEGAAVRVVVIARADGSTVTATTNADGHFSTEAITEFGVISIGDRVAPSYVVEVRFAGKRYAYYSGFNPIIKRQQSLQCNIPTQHETYQKHTIDDEFVGTLKMECRKDDY